MVRNLVRIPFFLGMLASCLGTSFMGSNIKERFCNAHYAFKFRVTSPPKEECFFVTASQTTTETPTVKTTVLMETDASTQVTSTEARPVSSVHTTNTPPSTQQTSTVDSAVPTVWKTTVSSSHNVTGATSSNEDSTITESKTKAPSTTSVLTDSTQPTEKTTESIQNSIATATNEPSSEYPTSVPANTNQTQPSTDETLSEYPRNLSATTSETPPTTKPNFEERPSSSRQTGNKTGLEPDGPKVNMISSNQTLLRKKRCVMMVKYQDILIRKSRIFKGDDKIKQMKRVKDADEKYYYSTVRLGLYSRPLQASKNYFFMGRVVPRANSENYVFMANTYTVVPWKDVRKHQKLLRDFVTNHQNTC